MMNNSGAYSDLAMPEFHADYTTQLGHLVALGYDNDAALHLDKYPIFDEAYRNRLNRKIIEHYIFREIGVETPQMFAFNLGRKMNEIMPYYNQLYVSTQTKFDPLLTQDLYNDTDQTQTSESSAKSSAQQTGKNDTTSDTTTKTHSSATTVHSEFPQTRLADFLQYATNADQTNSDTDSNTSGSQSATSSSSGSNSTDFTHQTDSGSGTTHSHGYAGMSGAQLITAWRSAMLNVDMMIIEELAPLFMRIVGTPARMTWPRYGGPDVYTGVRF